MVTTSAASAAPAAAGLPAVLPSGYVAVSIPYAPGASNGTGEGTGGYIQALDRIDILVYNPAGTTLYWAYQKVLVLAIGESSGAPAAAASSSAGATASSHHHLRPAHGGAAGTGCRRPDRRHRRQ